MNEMSNETQQYQVAARNAIRELLSSLNKDLLNNAEEFRSSLNHLLKNGKTDNGHICLFDTDVEQEPAQVFFDASTIQCALQSLDILSTDNAMNVVNYINCMNSNFSQFDSFSRMRQLGFRISQCKKALQLI